MQNLTVLGAGVLGSQIALQAAYHGKSVTVFDVDPGVLESLPERWDYLGAQYLRDLPDATDELLAAAVDRISTSTDLEDAVADAEIIIECVPEVLEIKRETWTRVGRAATTTAVFATNSSTFVPSQIADATGSPDRVMALHFANDIWRQSLVEAMGHEGTSADVFDAGVTFAEEMGMTVVRVEKEQSGYILNSLLVPFLRAAAKLYVREIASVEDIDATWRMATGSPFGPFQIYDIVGLKTPYHLNVRSSDEDMRAFAEILKRDFIDQGKLGRGTGSGFYTYS